MEQDDPTSHSRATGNVRTLAGPIASIAFTNLCDKRLSLRLLLQHLRFRFSYSRCSGAGRFPQGVLALMNLRDIDIPLERVCILDPKAPLGTRVNLHDFPLACPLSFSPHIVLSPLHGSHPCSHLISMFNEWSAVRLGRICG